ncbi:phosphotransferase enzyme family protein [Paenibacillus sp. GCM10023252]|uniref:phosphotransferase enzyme family protein n=1 Tax=Paenibacillus sp. GCM10023252 TaxID=3252649 RepID=UPI00361448E8
MMELGLDEIADDVKRRFRVHIIEASPIDKGWLNVKWKVMTNEGPCFLKLYHPERYKLHLHPDRRIAIEKTLQLQDGMSEAGVPAPYVLADYGQYLQATPSGRHYAMMDWVDGYNAMAGFMTSDQMYDLGRVTGRMHKWLQAVPLLDKPVWKPDKAAYLRDWQTNWDKAAAAGDDTVMEWLRRSHDIAVSADFHIHDRSPIGWLHWDLWVDNLLLNEQRVAGIVDFDRMTVGYPEMDVARAILSGSLRDGHLQLETAKSFVDGYRTQQELPHGTLSRAIRMLYFFESIWWLRTEIREESELRSLLGRFVEEIHWIQDHWSTLLELDEL